MAGREYSQEEMKNIYNSLDYSEGICTKKEMIVDVKIATFNEEIITKIDGDIETTNTAKIGDFIITGIKGERYVLTIERFNEKYILLEKGKAASRKKVKNYIVLDRFIKFIAPWGELMSMKRNDVIVRDGEEYYGINRDVFFDTYDR